MTRAKAFEQYEDMPPEEKKEYSCFEDYLGANAMCSCEGCDNVVEYDEVDENGNCFDCQVGDEECEEDE